MRRTLTTAVIALLLTSGCATAGGTREGSRQDVISPEELSSVQVPTLYEAVQRLRPRWLTVRAQRSFNSATQIVVYQNQTQLGGFDALRELGPSAAVWIQYLDGPTAAASLPGLGSRQVEGAIVIHTTQPRP